MLSKLKQYWTKPILNKIIFATLLAFFTLFLLELSVRLFSPQDISPTIALLDPVLGYTLKPNSTAIHRTSEFDTLISTNSYGLRSSEINHQRSNKTRVLFIGDSFTYGWGVQVEERFSDILETKLDFEMINTGVPGYKASNILAFYEVEGYKYHPDVVVYFYNLRTGTANINSLEFRVVNKSLITYPLYASTTKNRLKLLFTRIPGYSFLTEHSQFFAFFRNQVVDFLNRPVISEITQNCSYLEKNWYVHNKEREVLILQKLQEETRKQNATFMIILLPLLSCNFTNITMDFINTTQLNVLDLTPFFPDNSSSYYYSYDGHWNKNGHAYAAEIVKPYLQEKLPS